MPRLPTITTSTPREQISPKSQSARARIGDPRPKVRQLLHELSENEDGRSTILQSRHQPHERLKKLSFVFGEVIDNLPSYRPILMRIQEEYDDLVREQLRTESTTKVLRSYLRAEAGKVRRLEEERMLFQGEHCWSEACALRRELKASEEQCSRLQAEIKDVKDKCDSASRLLTGKLNDSQLQSDNTRQLLRSKAGALQKERWRHGYHLALWSQKMMQALAGHRSVKQKETEEEDETTGSGGRRRRRRRRLDSEEEEGEEEETEEEDVDGESMDKVEDLFTSAFLFAQGGPGLARNITSESLHSTKAHPSHTTSVPSHLSRIQRSHSITSSRRDSSCSGFLGHDPSRHPEEWGMTVSQFVDFYEDIESELCQYCNTHGMLCCEDGQRIHVCNDNPCKWPRKHATEKYVSLDSLPVETVQSLTPVVPNMYLVVDLFIKPMTVEAETSYSLFVNEGGRRINTFVTHVWSDEFPNFIEVLQTSLHVTDVAWVCSFAIPQNNFDRITDLLDQEDLRQCPFGVALQKSPNYLVVLDNDAAVPSRAWCTYEIGLASSLGKAIRLWPHRTCDFKALHGSIDSLNLETAEATNKVDEKRIKNEIVEKMGGFHRLNKKVQELMHDRARFAQQFIELADKEKLELIDACERELKEEQEKNEAGLRELERLNRELESALSAHDTHSIGELYKQTEHLKMDEQTKKYWATMNELRIQLEFAPLKAAPAATKAIQVFCRALNEARNKEPDHGFHASWCTCFQEAFAQELSDQLENTKADILAFMAQAKLPQDFCTFFLPAECVEKQKELRLLSDASKAPTQSDLDDNFDNCLKRLNDLNTKLDSHTFQSGADADLVLQLRETVMKMVRVTTQERTRAANDNETRADDFEEERKKARKEVDDLREQLCSERTRIHEKEQELIDKRDETKVLQFRLDETVKHDISEHCAYEKRIKALGTELHELQQSQAKIVHEHEKEINELKKQLEAAEEENIQYKDELQGIRTELHDLHVKHGEVRKKNAMLEIRALKPLRESSKPKITIEALSTALVRVACDVDAPSCRCGWCDRFQETFKTYLGEKVPQYKKDVQDHVLAHCHADFPGLFLAGLSQGKCGQHSKLAPRHGSLGRESKRSKTYTHGHRPRPILGREHSGALESNRPADLH